MAKEELRLEAYRRLAAVTTEAEVDDIRAEWEDRYGPVPTPAEALLAVGPPAGRVPPRSASARSVSRAGWCGLTPLALKTSEEVRFRRLARDGVYKAELGEVQLRVPKKGDLPSMVVDFLRELRPPDGEQPEGHR